LLRLRKTWESDDQGGDRAQHDGRASSVGSGPRHRDSPDVRAIMPAPSSSMSSLYTVLGCGVRVVWRHGKTTGPCARSRS
jgi:hypothetical protein